MNSERRSWLDSGPTGLLVDEELRHAASNEALRISLTATPLHTVEQQQPLVPLLKCTRVGLSSAPIADHEAHSEGTLSDPRTFRLPALPSEPAPKRSDAYVPVGDKHHGAPAALGPAITCRSLLTPGPSLDRMDLRSGAQDPHQGTHGGPEPSGTSQTHRRASCGRLTPHRPATGPWTA
jgi:hypothetical protein